MLALLRDRALSLRDRAFIEDLQLALHDSKLPLVVLFRAPLVGVVDHQVFFVVAIHVVVHFGVPVRGRSLTTVPFPGVRCPLLDQSLLRLLERHARRLHVHVGVYLPQEVVLILQEGLLRIVHLVISSQKIRGRSDPLRAVPVRWLQLYIDSSDVCVGLSVVVPRATLHSIVHSVESLMWKELLVPEFADLHRGSLRHVELQL